MTKPVMRNYIDILNERQKPFTRTGFLQELALFESRAQYEQMFAPLYTVAAFFPNKDELTKKLAGYFQLATSFKKNDRVVWAINNLRAIFVMELKPYLAANKIENPQIDKIVDKFSDYRNISVREIRTILTHYLAIPFHKIQNFVFPPNATPSDVIAKMREFETEFKERKKGLVTQQPGDEIILKFPNGMMWMKLSRGGCSEEAAAMGHCGNGSGRTGQNILSLRKFRKDIDGEKLYEPFLTFIREPDGKLGEMKGKNNDKPVSGYHPEIIALLKLPLITGITGGGYLPEHNFSINDLTPEQQDDLLNEKPELGGWIQMLRRQGLSEEVQELFKTAWSNAFGSRTSDVELVDKALVRYKAFKDVNDFVQDHGDSNMKYWANIVFEGDHLDIDYEHIDSNYIKSFYDNLPINYKKAVIKKLSSLAPEPKEESEDEHDEDEEGFDFNDLHTSNVIELLEHFDDETYNIMRDAISDGERVGMEKDAYETIVSTLNNIDFTTGRIVIDPERPDSPVYYEFTPEEANALMESEDGYGLEIGELAQDERFPIRMNDVDGGYDEDYATERFKEEFGSDNVDLGLFAYRIKLDTKKEIIQAIKDLNAKSIPVAGQQPLLKLTYSDTADEESLKRTFRNGFKKYYGTDYVEPIKPAKQA